MMADGARYSTCGQFLFSIPKSTEYIEQVRSTRIKDVCELSAASGKPMPLPEPEDENELRDSVD